MKFLKNQNLEDLLFIDIETANLVQHLEKDTPLYDSWEYKMRYSRDAISSGDKSLESLYEESASLYPEFGKIVCIVIGKIVDGALKIKVFDDASEKDLLYNFNNAVNTLIARNKNLKLCGQYIVGFDIPYIMTRSIINNVDPCSLVDTAHLKPWEVTAVDTHTLWKGTSSRSASLINMVVALGLDNPKDDIMGHEVNSVYYNEPDGLKRIVKYCVKDVLAVANIVRRCRFEDIVECDFGEETEEPAVGLLQKIFNTKIMSPEDKLLLDSKVTSLDETEKKIADTIIEICIK